MMNIEIVVPANASVDLLPTVTPRPFDDSSLALLQYLSAHLLKSPRSRAFPELVALGYWLRKANILALKKAFEASTPADTVRHGRGLAFHIAPSNVDTIFVYSLVVSLLCGNRNVVRLSSTGSEQIEILVDALNEALRDPALRCAADSLRIVRYEHSAEINEFFSANCDLRIIWGGDNTIDAIRKAPLRPHALDIAFANKYSFAIIDAVGWLGLTDAERDRQALLFSKDAATFNQQACSSPRMVAWLCAQEEVCAEAKRDFWGRVAQFWAPPDDLQPVDYSNRVLYTQSHMIEYGSKLCNSVSDNIYRLTYSGPALIEQVEFCGSGIFSELHIRSLEELGTLISRKVQTISVAGFDKAALRAGLLPLLAQGVDRVVPFGRALDFHPIWDGFNLWEALSRLTSFAQLE